MGGGGKIGEDLLFSGLGKSGRHVLLEFVEED